MAFAPRYATLHDLRDRGITQGTLSDADALEALEDVSRWVEEYTDQIFYPRVETIKLDGQHHRILSHPSLWPILSDEEDVVVNELTDRTRTSTYLGWESLSDIVTIDADEYSLRNNHPRRYIDKNHGVWNEGSHNFEVSCTWGWLDSINKVSYTLSAQFDPGDTQLSLTSVAALRNHDVGLLPDGTVLTIVAVDSVNKIVTVEGGDLLTAAVATGQTFVRWGKVPTSVRMFVIESIYINSGAGSGGTGSCPWLRREKTDTYEYERFSPADMGMDNGNYWTGNTMIDDGLARFRRPTYIGLI